MAAHNIRMTTMFTRGTDTRVFHGVYGPTHAYACPVRVGTKMERYMNDRYTKSEIERKFQTVGKFLKLHADKPHEVDQILKQVARTAFNRFSCSQ